MKCPRCASEIGVNDKVCPKCRLEVSKMEKFASKNGESFNEQKFEEQKTQKPGKKVLTKEEKRQAKIDAKLAKKKERQERKLRESVSDTDFSKFASNSKENKGKSRPNDTYANRRKNAREKELTPQFEIDENGEFNIDTSDVEIVGEETGKMIEQVHQNEYSIKKARGDYKQPKIKWWEIYKIADRSFARRKIKKEVNKAAIQKPGFIKKSKLLLLAIFLGGFGAHNFYAKNKRKGWLSVVTFIIWIGVVMLAQYSAFFKSITVSVAGFAGFINLFIWFGDIVAIATNRFKYRMQKEAFIFGLNVETRAKLGNKYIDLELYKKPWWVKLKVWWNEQKETRAIAKREREQRRIEREKQKIAEAEEKAKIDSEIAEYEASENSKTDEQKSADQKVDISKVVNKQMLDDIQKFEGEVDDNEPAYKKETTKDVKNFVNNKNKAKKSFKSKNKKK